MPSASVLVIDDEEVVRTVAGLMLERAGYRVTTAASGAEGVAAFARDRPGVVLLDLSLPDRPGAAVLGELVALDPAARVVVVSGAAPDAGVPAGACGFLHKPFSTGELLKAVRG